MKANFHKLKKILQLILVSIIKHLQLIEINNNKIILKKEARANSTE